MRGDRRTAVVAIAALALVTAAIFLGVDPFSQAFELRAQVANATQLRPGNPVRIAGVDVGEVKGVSAGPSGSSTVSMRIDPVGLPIYQDATLRIEPRLALEGNNYVRLNPGSSRTEELDSGSSLAIEQTAGSVGIDQVLGVFQRSTRDALKAGVGAVARGLGPEGSPRSGGAGLEHAARELDSALHDLTQVARAARGQMPGDLGQATETFGQLTQDLTDAGDSLAELPENVNRLSSAVTASEGSLGASVRELDSVVRRAPSALVAIDSAAPPLRQFAVDLKPVLEEAGTALPRVDRLVAEVGRAARPGEVPQVIDELAPLARRLPRLESLLTESLPYAERIGTCTGGQIVPALTQEVPDGEHSTGRPAYQDFVHAFTNLSAANPSFDANGRILRAVAAGGEKTLTALVPPFGKAVAGIAPDIQGVSPLWLGVGVDPPWEPGKDCRKQELPDLTHRRNIGLLPDTAETQARPAAKTPGPSAFEKFVETLGGKR